MVDRLMTVRKDYRGYSAQSQCAFHSGLGMVVGRGVATSQHLRSRGQTVGT